MSDQPPQTDAESAETPFDTLLAATAADAGFNTAFRGYDKDEVDAAISQLKTRLRTSGDEAARLKDERHRATTSLAQLAEPGRRAGGCRHRRPLAGQRRAGRAEGEAEGCRKPSAAKRSSRSVRTRLPNVPGWRRRMPS
ncbi:DivIVA domain-containing protein [Microbacterium elymi]|uniref:DivIVA domain-containing protein n=1 Tax=Microbacterium elymi TaxID=2909587 RepID=A0ABY5NLE6_9MICO|nr:DivIVA domain-containing protein [Microbacterium elymi]UUT35954.1 DivIVA domain-containing protein [Microbacterium elymi]